jgi:hypothetical protein
MNQRTPAYLGAVRALDAAEANMEATGGRRRNDYGAVGPYFIWRCPI